MPTRPAFFLALASSSALLCAPAQAITSWSFSFDAGAAGSASGTLTTANVTPTAYVTYPVTGIGGTYTLGSTSYPITGLYGSINYFQWSGPGSSLNSNLAGISFRAGTGFVNVYGPFTANPNDFLPIFSAVSNVSGSIQFPVASSSLSPDETPASATGAPGPLPLLGASVAFGWSRRLKQRLLLQHFSDL